MKKINRKILRTPQLLYIILLQTPNNNKRARTTEQNRLNTK